MIKKCLLLVQPLMNYPLKKYLPLQRYKFYQ